MKIVFHQQYVWEGVLYERGEVATVDADQVISLVDNGIASYFGGGTRHATTWLDVVQGAVGINPAGAVAAPTPDTTETGFPGSILFSGSADNLLVGSWQINHDWQEGTALEPHIHWMLTADSANAVGWEFYYRVCGIGAVAGAWVGPVAGTLAVSHGNKADTQALSTFGSIPLIGQTVSCLVLWRLYRRGSTDANNSDARLLSIDAHYRSDGTGSALQYIKDV